MFSLGPGRRTRFGSSRCPPMRRRRVRSCPYGSEPIRHMVWTIRRSLFCSALMSGKTSRQVFSPCRGDGIFLTRRTSDASDTARLGRRLANGKAGQRPQRPHRIRCVETGKRFGKTIQRDISPTMTEGALSPPVRSCVCLPLLFFAASRRICRLRSTCGGCIISALSPRCCNGSPPPGEGLGEGASLDSPPPNLPLQGGGITRTIDALSILQARGEPFNNNDPPNG